MSVYFENLGFESVCKSTESFGEFIDEVYEQSWPIYGYYGKPYINSELGWPQFIIRPGYENQLSLNDLSGFDTHISGITTWQLRISADITPAGSDKMSRIILASAKARCAEAAVITLVNADVLPSFLPGELIRAQMVGFAKYIRYFRNADAYYKTLSKDTCGATLLISDGSVCPAEYLKNYGIAKAADAKQDFADRHVMIRGTVKQVGPGKRVYCGEEYHDFYDVVIDTCFGDLEIVHTENQVPESDRKNIRVGAVVYGCFELSGDVAIGQHKNGIVKSEENAYKLVRYTLQGGDPERLRPILSESSEYISAENAETHRGADEIITRLKLEQSLLKCFSTHYGVIYSIDSSRNKLPYKVGDCCIIMSENIESGCIHNVFLSLDSGNNIEKLCISSDEGYYTRPLDTDTHPVHHDNHPLRVKLQYAVCFGCGDSSDWIEWETELYGDAKKAYRKAQMLHLAFEDFQELSQVLSDAEAEIAEVAVSDFIDADDEYVRECLGQLPVDPDDINYLVSIRDPYTLEYFDLLELDEEELDEWDANDIFDLPDVCDFEEDFEPKSPFDEGWSLLVEFAEHPEDKDISYDEAVETISHLLNDQLYLNSSILDLQNYITSCEHLYFGPGSLADIADSIIHGTDPELPF